MTKIITDLRQQEIDTPVLYLWNDISLLIRRSPSKVIFHKLMIDAFIINLDGNFEVYHNKLDSSTTCRSVYWPSYEIHRWESNDVMAFVFIEPSYIFSNQIRKNMIHDKKYFLTKILNEPHAIEILHHIYTTHPSSKDTFELLRSAIVTNGKLSNIMIDNPLRFDHRVSKLMKIIRTNPEENIPIKDLGSMICLSDSRTEHIFKSNLNMPITQYRKLWRLKAASGYLDRYGKISTAALESGFNDLPHFTNAFRSFSGMTPSSIYGSKLAGRLKIIISDELSINFNY